MIQHIARHGAIKGGDLARLMNREYKATEEILRRMVNQGLLAQSGNLYTLSNAFVEQENYKAEPVEFVAPAYHPPFKPMKPVPHPRAADLRTMSFISLVK